MPDIQDADSIEIQGSGAKPYVLKNTGGIYSHSVPPGEINRSRDE